MTSETKKLKSTIRQQNDKIILHQKEIQQKDNRIESLEKKIKEVIEKQKHYLFYKRKCVQLSIELKKRQRCASNDNNVKQSSTFTLFCINIP
jgi:predicted RNase H-like nuclease (RuvC/YqgF family)